jgi:hypothetical protein
MKLALIGFVLRRSDKAQIAITAYTTQVYSLLNALRIGFVSYFSPDPGSTF